jgi:penicillin-binding protein 1A
MENKAEQYYPTYTFKPEYRDVVLLEFGEAQKIANGQSKVYGQVTNILTVAITLLIPLFFNQNNEAHFTLVFVKENALFFSIIIFLFGAFLLRYFVDLQKQITINGRKVVTLRTMLGLDYGPIQLTLPNWRVEGATNPFTIKYFNGWSNFQSMPFWVLTIGVNAIWWLTTFDKPENLLFELPWYVGNIFITLVYLFVFRRNLNDLHETSFLNIGKLLANLLLFKLVKDFEYIIYRAKLEVVEMSRLNVNYENLKSILIDIEDKSFYKNIGGVSFSALLRGAMSQVKPLKKKYKLIGSGGSTITMQLARTLFIRPNQNKYVRKLFEIWLSFWLNRKFTKEQILDIYIVSVRYDYGVMGLSNAIKHFYGSINKKKLSLEESFVLVERLSNITGTYKPDRIEYLIKNSSQALDKDIIDNIYQNLIIKRKIKK